MMNEMERDLYTEITNAMFGAYANHSRIARGLDAARKVMDDMFTVLPVNETVKAEVLKHWESTYGYFKVR